MRYPLATIISGLVLAMGVAASPAMAQGGHDKDDHGYQDDRDGRHDNGRHGGHGHDDRGYGDRDHDGRGYGDRGHDGRGYGPPPHMNPYYAHYGWGPGQAPHYHPLPPRPIVYRAPPRPGYWVTGARYYDPGYAPTVVVADYGDYGLLPPPPGYGWRRSPAGDFLLVAAASGIIADVLLHH